MTPDILGVSLRVVEDLRDLHEEHERDGLTFRHWIPRSERKHRKRLFVASIPDGRERYVAKIALDPADEMVAHEWRILTELHGTQTVVPMPVHELDGGFAMASVGNGDLPDMLAASDGGGWEQLLIRGVEVGAAVHLSAGPLTCFEASGLVPGDKLRRYPDVTVDALRLACIGPTHGDMGPWNFRVGDVGEIALIDWEDYATLGICALDVLNLVITAALIAYPAYREEGFAWLFDHLYHGSGPYHEASNAALVRYAELTGQPPETVLALTPVFCDAMIRRIRAQRRPTEHLFFRPLAERFLRNPVCTLGGGHG